MGNLNEYFRHSIFNTSRQQGGWGGGGGGYGVGGVSKIWKNNVCSVALNFFIIQSGEILRIGGRKHDF